MELDHTFLERYKIKEEIGSGSFGRVYKLQHISKNKTFALKIDIRLKGNVLNEAKILADLHGGIGITKLYKHGSTDHYSYMIIELLECTLGNLLQKSAGKFNLTTVISIMLQLIARIEFVHSKGYLHRDLKPQQILIGKNPRILYLTDFGLARRFEVNHYHVSYHSSCARVGNSTFSSLNNHSGGRQSRRDDLESLAYLAVYLFRGSLPWQLGKRLSTNAKWQNAFEMKTNMTVEEICNNCPIEFGIFLKYCRSLKFEEKPDYGYISQLFSKVREQYSLKEMYFQWVDKSDDSDLRRKSLHVLIPKEGLQLSNTSYDISPDKEVECSRNLEVKDDTLRAKQSNRTKQRRPARSRTCFQGKNTLLVHEIDDKSPSSFTQEHLIQNKHPFDQNEFNLLQTTPKNILPEMKNRKKIVLEENESKSEIKCIMF